MVEERVWQGESEGNLARRWEGRLKPRIEPGDRLATRHRRVAPWVGTVAWLGMLWAGAAMVALIATQVMTMSYHYDQMNQNYSALTRQEQSLQATVATMTSAHALAQDAARLHVVLVVPGSTVSHSVARAKGPVGTTAVQAPRQSHGGLGVATVTAWMQKLSQTLGQ